MQIVTFLSSAKPTIFFKPMAQFSNPSSSDMPLRLPEKQITFGSPLAAANSICSRIAFSSLSWFVLRLKQSPIVQAPLSIAHVRPKTWYQGSTPR